MSGLVLWQLRQKALPQAGQIVPLYIDEFKEDPPTTTPLLNRLSSAIDVACLVMILPHMAHLGTLLATLFGSVFGASPFFFPKRLPNIGISFTSFFSNICWMQSLLKVIVFTTPSMICDFHSKKPVYVLIEAGSRGFVSCPRNRHAAPSLE